MVFNYVLKAEMQLALRARPQAQVGPENGPGVVRNEGEEQDETVSRQAFVMRVGDG